MATTDFLNALGAGVPFSTKELITSLVDAERAPAEARIQGKIDDSNAKISAFGTAVSELTKLQDAAKTLNDSTDFDAFFLIAKKLILVKTLVPSCFPIHLLFLLQCNGNFFFKIA